VTSSTQLVQDVLWCAHPALQAVLVAIMYRRKMHRTFPVFFAYLIAEIAIFLVLFPLQGGSYKLFFYTYWATAAISVVLGFKVIHEIFLDVFRPYHTLRDLGTVLFRWAGLVMLMVAGVVAASSNGTNQEPLAAGILTLQRSVRVVQVGLVLFLLVFSRYLGISWKQKSFGVALGLGTYAGVELLLVALNATYSSAHYQNMSSIVNMAAYNVAILTWIGYALAPEQERLAVPVNVQSRRWELGLSDLQHPAGATDSLIPMFEGMVDRALSRGRAEDHPTELDQVLAKTDSVLARQTGTGSPRFEPVSTAIPQR
jgi:hypothetical protein